MESAETGTGARRHDLDWLRILVIGLLIPFHTAIMFDDGVRPVTVSRDRKP